MAALSLLFAQMPPASNAPSSGKADASQIYDIELPTQPFSYGPWITGGLLALLLIAALGAALYFALRKKSPRSLSPSQRIRRSLSRLERHIEQLPPNRFALDLSDALKDYFSGRYQDRVRYETAEEFLTRLSRDDLAFPTQAQQGLVRFLSDAEMLKFGRPADAEQRKRPLLDQAYLLIDLCETINGSSPAISR